MAAQAASAATARHQADETPWGPVNAEGHQRKPTATSAPYQVAYDDAGRVGLVTVSLVAAPADVRVDPITRPPGTKLRPESLDPPGVDPRPVMGSCEQAEGSRGNSRTRRSRWATGAARRRRET